MHFLFLNSLIADDVLDLHEFVIALKEKIGEDKEALDLWTRVQSIVEAKYKKIKK